MRPSLQRNGKTYVILDDLSSFEEKQSRRFEINGEEVAAFMIGGKIVAFEGYCPHERTLLANGFIDSESITCHAHGWKFSLKDGSTETPGACPIKIYDVIIESDAAWVNVE